MLHQGWLVGSACDWLLKGAIEADPRDFDLLIEPAKFQDACKVLTDKPVRVNSFGGLQYVGPPIVDFIPLTLSTFILHCSPAGANIAIQLHPFIVVRW